MATPPGQGGVGIVRISGPDARRIGEEIVCKALRLRHLALVDFRDAKGDVLDQGLAARFEAPASYTGEDVVELQAHGSPIVLSMLIDRSVELGARLALPGEFSERAFLNGKLDLIQAEAVADLIASDTRTAAKAAMRSLQGEFSRVLEALDANLLSLRAEVEASIDFADEAEDFIDAQDIQRGLGALQAELGSVLVEAAKGAELQQSVRVVLAGAPNVGKSSLLNRLAGYERAIVSSQPGTTRDILDENLLFGGLRAQMVDTAGLRPSPESIEAEGVKRAQKAIALADLRIHLWDATRPETRGIWTNPEAGQKAIEVMNKSDLLKGSAPSGCIAVSAKYGTGVQELKESITKALGRGSGEPAFLARTRHLQALRKSQEHLAQAMEEQQENRAAELVAEELRAAHRCLGQITGFTTTEDLLGEIFRNFCLGK